MCKITLVWLVEFVVVLGFLMEEGHSQCSLRQFTCANKECLPIAFRCDNEKDCSDGSDEDPEECSKRCSAEQFTCANKRCIPLAFKCDYDDDCLDGSDEDPKECIKGCSSDQFTCANKKCIPIAFTCDGDRDCYDGSDEDPKECIKGCSSEQFTCANKNCIPITFKCDGERDCYDGSDEDPKECTKALPLKNVVLTIEPDVVQRHNSSRLRCSYDLEGQDLYAVKWYRGNHEFYRYTPSESPSTKVFVLRGITVDVNKSNSTQVVLRDIDFFLSGNFSCEVTVDKTFSTRVDTQTMLVVQLPDFPPEISVGREPLDYGDTLKANCSSPPARPRASLKFVLNNLTVARTDPITSLHYYQSGWSDLFLDMVLSKYHFNDGKLILRCIAEVDDIYHEEAVLRLPSAKEPRPQRVSAFDSGSSAISQTVLQLVIVCCVALVLS